MFRAARRRAEDHFWHVRTPDDGETDRHAAVVVRDGGDVLRVLALT